MADDIVPGFLEWARSSLTPLSTTDLEASSDELSSLGKMIGDSALVALSESVHCAAEPLEFRNRLFQYLVEHKGFTAIAIESGVVESHLVHEYVRGADLDIAEVMRRGFSWSFGSLPQNRTLIEWLRAFNASRRSARTINFYGFDISGSPTNASADRGVNTALGDALNYISSVDPAAGADFQERLGVLLPLVRFSVRATEEGVGYDQMSQTERDRLTATIADLITLLERRETQYRLAGTQSSYEWGHRAAIAARQIDSWLRHIPVGWRPCEKVPLSFEDLPIFFSMARDARDRAQADNVDWVVKQEDAAGKVLIFGSRYHLSSTPVKAAAMSRLTVEKEQEVAGTHLRRRWGNRLISIGNLIGGGTFGLRGAEREISRAPRDSFEGLAATVGAERFLLDLRSAPPSIANWLKQEQRLVDGLLQLKLPVGQAFDILFYIDSVTPAYAKSS